MSAVFVIGDANDPHAGWWRETLVRHVPPDGCRSLHRADAVRQVLMGVALPTVVGRPAADQVAKPPMTSPALSCAVTVVARAVWRS